MGVLIKAVQESQTPEVTSEFLRILDNNGMNGEVTEEELVKATTFILEAVKLSVDKALNTVDDMFLIGDISRRDQARRIKHEIRKFAADGWIAPKDILKIIGKYDKPTR